MTTYLSENSQFSIVNNGVLIEFYREPDLDAIAQARKMLDGMTDDLIRRNLNESK